MGDITGLITPAWGGASSFIPSVLTTAGISAAALAASTAGGGVVVLPAQTITLTGSLPLYSNVIYSGAGYALVSASAAPTSGTILSGDGTFPAFYFVGIAGGSAAQATLGDLGSAASQPTWAAAFASGVGVRNMAFNNFSYAIKAGAFYNPSFRYSKFENLFAYSCTQFGFWFENFQEVQFTGLTTNVCANGQYYGASGTTNLNCGNSWVSQIFNEGSGQGAGQLGSGRGLWFNARGASTSLNYMVVRDAQSNGTGQTSSQVSVPTNGSALLPVTDLTKFAIDMPVTFAGSANGFGTTIYFVVAVSGASGAGTISVALTLGGTAINSTGTSSNNVITYGYSAFEVSAYSGNNGITFSMFRNLDVESGGTAPIVIQNVFSSYFDFGLISAGPGPVMIAWRNSQRNFITNTTFGGLKIDRDSTALDNLVFGQQLIDQFGNLGNQPGIAGTGTSTNKGLTLSGGQANPDLAYTAAAAQLVWSMAQLYPTAQFAASGNAGRAASVITFTGSTGQTISLPNVTANTLGNPFWIDNPTVNSVTVTTVGGTQNFIGLGTSGTSLTIAANSCCHVISRSNGGTFFYARHS